MERTNEQIRRTMGANGLKQWEVAEAMGMNESNFSRKLRKELSEEEKTRVLSAIETIVSKRK